MWECVLWECVLRESVVACKLYVMENVKCEAKQTGQGKASELS